MSDSIPFDRKQDWADANAWAAALSAPDPRQAHAARLALRQLKRAARLALCAHIDLNRGAEVIPQWELLAELDPSVFVGRLAYWTHHGMALTQAHGALLSATLRASSVLAPRTRHLIALLLMEHLLRQFQQAQHVDAPVVDTLVSWADEGLLKYQCGLEATTAAHVELDNEAWQERWSRLRQTLMGDAQPLRDILLGALYARATDQGAEEGDDPFELPSFSRGPEPGPALEEDPSTQSGLDPFEDLIDRPIYAPAPESAPRPPDGPATARAQFSIVAPGSVRPDDAFPLDLWAHLEGDYERVMASARRDLGMQRIYRKSAGPVALDKGVQLSVTIAIPALGYAEEEWLRWDGAPVNASFMPVVAQGTAHGLLAGCAEIRHHDLRILRLHFSILVTDVSMEMEDRLAALEPTRRAFASYASEDRAAVLARVQGMQKVAPDLDVFLDAISIRSGQDWLQRIEAEILARDTFYLFWSRHAQQSPWVEHEWRFALARRGLQFIDPVPLEPPAVVKPPIELASLHMSDWMLNLAGGEGS